MKRLILIAASAVALSGCAVYATPGYYVQPVPVTVQGSFWIGGGGYYHPGWRR